MKKESIEAVIFDMDGVISDTQIIHSQTESEMLQKYGIDLHPDEITKKYSGVKDGVMFREIFKKSGKEMPPLEDLTNHKWSKMAQIAGSIAEVPGTSAFISNLKKMGLPLAVASSSRLSFIELVLKELNLRDQFKVIASAEEVEMGKPAPDIFLLAAKRLGVLPEKCVVIEDGIAGMIGAKKADMYCIALATDGSKDYPADLIVKNLLEVPMDLFRK